MRDILRDWTANRNILSKKKKNSPLQSFYLFFFNSYGSFKMNLKFLSLFLQYNEKALIWRWTVLSVTIIYSLNWKYLVMKPYSILIWGIKCWIRFKAVQLYFIIISKYIQDKPQRLLTPKIIQENFFKT